MPTGPRPAARQTVVLLALLTALSSCAAPEAPTGPAPASSPATAPASPQRFGAPTVDTPRDISTRAADPCGRLLTSSQLDELGLERVGRFRFEGGNIPECSWHGATPARSLAVSVWTHEDLLADTYRQHAGPGALFTIFRPMVIAGLPAVEQQDNHPASCVTTVGVAARQGMDVFSDIDEREPDGRPAIEPCTQGRRAIEAIVSTLPPS